MMGVTSKHVWRREGSDQELTFGQVRQMVLHENAPATDFWTEVDKERRSFSMVIKALYRDMRHRFPDVDYLGQSPDDLERLAEVIKAQEHHRLLRPRLIPSSAIAFL